MLWTAWNPPTSVIFYIFIVATAVIVVLNERLEGIVIRRFFGAFLKEMEKVEEEIAEYQYLSVLAVVAKDREAYEGFQILMSEKYWPYFFRKMVFTTSLYFLLLSPYMLLVHYVLSNVVPNAFGIVLFMAVAYFTLRLGYSLARNFVDSYRAVKIAEENLKRIELK